MNEIPKEWRDHLVKIGSLGGKATAKSMTPEQRREKAIKAANSKPKPKKLKKGK